MHRIIRAGATALAVVAVAATAGAADYKGTGTVTYVTTGGEAVKLAGNRVKQQFRSKGVIIADDPASPIHLSVHDCAGSIVADAKGAPTNGSGYCEATDADGDVWWLSFSDYDGDGNTWTITGGTGKYQGMTGGGTVKTMMQSADGRSAARWEGAWTMK